MVGRFKETDAGRLRAEYNRLVEGLAQRGNLPSMLDIVIETKLNVFCSYCRINSASLILWCSHGYLALKPCPSR